MSKNLSKIWLKYDQNKKVCFPKKFKIVTTLQQNVSNRGGDGDGGGSGDGGVVMTMLVLTMVMASGVEVVKVVMVDMRGVVVVVMVLWCCRLVWYIQPPIPPPASPPQPS